MKPLLSFTRRPDGFMPRGSNYAQGRIYLGELDEPFWSSTAIWGVDRYRQSWLAATRLCLASRHPVLFYTDVTAKASMAYHAVPHRRDIVLFEQIFRGAYRPICRPMAARDIMRAKGEVSYWTAPFAALEPLAHTLSGELRWR